MVKSETVYQHYSYEPVGDVLKEKLKEIQESGGTVISITPTKQDNGYRCSEETFIVVYDDGKMDVNNKETTLFLNLNDAVEVVYREFGIDKELAYQELEQKCYLTNDQYKIGYNDAIEDLMDIINARRKKDV